MLRPTFMSHQLDALEQTKNKPRVAYYMGMGCGKTFVATEQMLRYGNTYNLCICQKSKVDDWVEHFKTYTDMTVTDYTQSKAVIEPGVIVVNYELVWRRPELLNLKNFTLILDESSKVQHEKTKQSRFILMLKPKNVILASGTPCNGKYENLYSQIQLLGVNIGKTYYWNRYIDYELVDNVKLLNGTLVRGKPYRKVNGYKRIEELKTNLRKCGAVFMLSDDVLDLPEQTEQIVKVDSTSEYRAFKKDRIIQIEGIEYIGDTSLKKMLRERQLCSFLNKHKLDALSDLLDSTEDRIIIFYNFQEDFVKISQICDKLGKKMSVVNGSCRDLTNYENDPSSVTLVQYQSGAHGLNLQKANKMVMFSLPLSCELFDQARGRIHRLGQKRPTFYWYLITKNSIEQRIYERLKEGHDYTVELFKEGK